MKAPIHWDLIPDGVGKDYVEDFRNHLFACFKYLFNTEPTPLQYAMADKLQSDLDGFQPLGLGNEVDRVRVHD